MCRTENGFDKCDLCRREISADEKPYYTNESPDGSHYSTGGFYFCPKCWAEHRLAYESREAKRRERDLEGLRRCSNALKEQGLTQEQYEAAMEPLVSFYIRENGEFPDLS